jgi:hypothetical protein
MPGIFHVGDCQIVVARKKFFADFSKDLLQMHNVWPCGFGPSLSAENLNATPRKEILPLPKNRQVLSLQRAPTGFAIQRRHVRAILSL